MTWTAPAWSPTTHPTVEHCGRASWRARAAEGVIKTFMDTLGQPALETVTGREQTLGVIRSYTGMARLFSDIDVFAGALRAPLGTRRQTVQLDGFHGEWLIGRGMPAPEKARRVILFFHGGAFMSCGLRTHRRLVARMGLAAGAPAFSVAYRQLPFAPISQSVEDAVTAYRHLLDSGIKPENIVLSGDSAGAHLCFSLAVAARERGLPIPAGIAAISPWLNVDPTDMLDSPYADTEPLFPKALMALIKTSGLHGDVEDPALSPVHADVTGLPPVLMQVGSTEIMRHDTEIMTQKLADAGVPVRLQLWDRGFHVFQVAADVLPEAKAAIRDLGSFIRSVTPDAVSPDITRIEAA